MEIYFIPYEKIKTIDSTSPSALVFVPAAEYVIDAYISCIWTRRYGSYYDFQIQIPATERNMSNIHMYDFVYRSKDRLPYTSQLEEDLGIPPVKNVMMIEKIEIEDNDDKHIMTISGRGVEAVFARMIMWTKATQQGKLKSVINSLLLQNGIYANVFDTEYREYWANVRYQCQQSGDYTDYIPNSCRHMDIDLVYDNDDIKPYDNDILCDTVNDYLGDTLTQILKPLGMYWYFYFSPANAIHIDSSGTWKEYGWKIELHIRDSWKHANLTENSYDVLFAKDNGTLLSSKYTEDSTQSFNCGQILGEGTGVDQIRVAYPYATGTALTDAQPRLFNRHESIVDNSSYTADTIVLVDQYKQLLVQNTEYQAVKNNGQSMEVELNLINSLYVYGDDDADNGYDIGSVVGFKTETGIMATARLVEMIESEDENGTKLTPTFDEWEFKTS